MPIDIYNYIYNSLYIGYLHIEYIYIRYVYVYICLYASYYISLENSNTSTLHLTNCFLFPAHTLFCSLPAFVQMSPPYPTYLYLSFI